MMASHDSNAATGTRKHEQQVGFVLSRVRGPAIVGLAIAISSAGSGGSRVVSAQAPTPSTSTRQHVQTLASDKLDGRLTGSAGERLAGDYIVSQLQKMGAKPAPGQTDYRVPFEFTAGSRDGGSTIGLTYSPPATTAGGFTGPGARFPFPTTAR